MGVLLSPEDAEGIARWLLDQVDMIRHDPDEDDE